MVNDEFHLFLEQKYEDINLARFKAVWSKIHDYLAMNLDFSVRGKVKIDMVNYIKNMDNEFLEDIQESQCPWNDNLFKVEDKESNCKMI
jgi:hypothetical protein